MFDELRFLYIKGQLVIVNKNLTVIERFRV